MVSQMTKKKEKRKNHGSGNHWPCFRSRKQKVFALLSLGTKVFLFMRLSQSLESWEKKQLLLDGDLESQQGPVSSGGYWQAWGGWRAPQLHLGVENEEEQDEVMPERRHRAAQAGSVLGMEKNIQSSSNSLSPSWRNWTPRCEKDYLQKHLFLPIPEWHPSFWLTSLSGSRNVRRWNRHI